VSRDLLGALPPVRGRYRASVPLAPRTWLRVGGPAEVVFQPADAADLAIFLKGKPAEVAVTPIGVASNLLVRDGGLEGVVVRFSGPLAEVDVDDECLRVGAGATDRMIAIQAMKAGLSGLEFLIGIPGTLGGAVRMNAGAFGGETAEVVERVVALDPAGRRHELRAAELGFGYRHSALPADWIVLGAVLRATQGDPEAIEARMRAIKAEREASQPLHVATGGSTFKNPGGKNPGGKNPPGHRAWQLIDAAGCRGLRHGRAMVSDKHCNFLINTGGATAAELEELGERVRARVLEHSGVALEWEIHRIGRPAPDRSVDDWEAAA
jgi:UDP-N-acetylmuramate dehydrogenase